MIPLLAVWLESVWIGIDVHFAVTYHPPLTITTHLKTPAHFLLASINQDHQASMTTSEILRKYANLSISSWLQPWKSIVKTFFHTPNIGQNVTVPRPFSLQQERKWMWEAYSKNKDKSRTNNGIKRVNNAFLRQWQD